MKADGRSGCEGEEQGYITEMCKVSCDDKPVAGSGVKQAIRRHREQGCITEMCKVIPNN